MRILPTLRQLRYLVALDEYRHFGRAAEACLATQSTLSAGLQELETLLGVTLVERTKRKVMLTPLGETVVARARELLRQAEDIADLATASASTPLSGLLRLGVIPTIAPYVLPQALPRLREAYPDLKLYLREDMTARLLEKLQAGELDVLLLALPYGGLDMDTMILCEDTFVVVCQENHPLARHKAISNQDLQKEDLLLLEEGHCMREHALAVCNMPGPTRGDGLLATSLVTLVQMVANGLGVTLLPQMALNSPILAGTNLVTRPLVTTGARQIGLVWRPSSPRQADYRALGTFLHQSELCGRSLN